MPVDAELMSAFDAINPTTLTYDDWFKVSAVMHDEGLSESEWDAWNRRDAERYTERINGRKWQSIKGDGTATRKTIFMLAHEAGWKWEGGSGRGRYDWNDEHVLNQATKGTPASPTKMPPAKPVTETPHRLSDYGEPEHIDVLPDDMGPAEMMRMQLSCMFRVGETVGIAGADECFHNQKLDKWQPKAGKVSGIEIWHHNAEKFLSNHVNAEAGAWVRANPTTGGKDDDVTRFASALVESDDLPMREQIDLMLRLHLPCRCITSSAAKSIHAVVAIDARDRAEYDERVRWLFSYCDANGLTVDHANKNPGRYTRLAGARRGGKVQRLVAVDVGPRSWGEFRARVAELEDIEDDADDDADEGPHIEFLDLSAIVEEPIEPIDEVIHGLLARERVAQLVARGGSGKTFLAYEAALCVAAGREWLGFGCSRGRSLFIDPELHLDDIHRRVKSIARGMGLTVSDVAGRFDVVALRGTTATADALDEAIRSHIKATGQRYDLIVIDSINAILTGDENSSVDMRAFIASLQRLTRDTGAACLTFHHSGKSGAKAAGELARGSSVFLDGPDECMELYPLKVEDGSAADELVRAHDQVKPNGEIIRSTAWRLTFPKHRTGAPIRPMNIIFRYPLHQVDSTGELDECKVAGSAADHGSDGGTAKGESFRELYDDMNAMLREIVDDLHQEGTKATRAACLPLLNERREGMGLRPWSKATFRNNTLRKGKLRFRVDPSTNELVELDDGQLDAEGGAVQDTP